MLKSKPLLLSLSLVSSFAFAGDPYRASDSVLSTFENFPDTAWQSVTTSIIDSVYVLKSDVRATVASWDTSTVHEKLGYLYPSNTAPGKRSLLSVNYERVDEPAAGFRNQCVAFGKAMTGAGSTSSWVKGTALTVLYPNQRAPSQLEAMAKLPPGTMLANFNGATQYPNTEYSHIVIVRGVNADTTGKVLSVDVYSQNGISKAVLFGNTVSLGDPETFNPKGGTIMKYTIPWSNTNSTKGSFSIKNYNIVNKP